MKNLCYNRITMYLMMFYLYFASGGLCRNITSSYLSSTGTIWGMACMVQECTSGFFYSYPSLISLWIYATRHCICWVTQTFDSNYHCFNVPLKHFRGNALSTLMYHTFSGFYISQSINLLSCKQAKHFPLKSTDQFQQKQRQTCTCTLCTHQPHYYLHTAWSWHLAASRGGVYKTGSLLQCQNLPIIWRHLFRVRFDSFCSLLIHSSSVNAATCRRQVSLCFNGTARNRFLYCLETR